MAGLERLAKLSSAMLERLEEEHGEDVDISMAVILVEIDTEPSGVLHMLSSDDRAWVQIAFLDEALRSLENRQYEMRARQRDERDDD
jgi:hypothetical protein